MTFSDDLGLAVVVECEVEAAVESVAAVFVGHHSWRRY
jgi:hypothetical protein